jgi:hypothetical protein
MAGTDMDSPREIRRVPGAALFDALRTTHAVFERRRMAMEALRQAVHEGTPEDVVRCAKELLGEIDEGQEGDRSSQGY